MKNGTIDEISLIKLLIIRANLLLRSRVGRQHGRRVHWPCAVAYAVEAFFLYFLASKNEAAGGNRAKSRENNLKTPVYSYVTPV